MILSIYFTLPPPSDVIIRLFCVFRNLCFMFFVIFVFVISSFLFYVFRLVLWFTGQPTLVEFDRFSRSRTTRSCGFAANILHSESTSFTSMGESRRRPPVAEISSAAFSCETSDLPGGQSCRLSMRTLVRVQLSPPEETRIYPRTGVTSGEYTCLITREE